MYEGVVLYTSIFTNLFLVERGPSVHSCADIASHAVHMLRPVAIDREFLD